MTAACGPRSQVRRHRREAQRRRVRAVASARKARKRLPPRCPFRERNTKFSALGLLVAAACSPPQVASLLQNAGVEPLAEESLGIGPVRPAQDGHGSVLTDFGCEVASVRRRARQIDRAAAISRRSEQHDMRLARSRRRLRDERMRTSAAGEEQHRSGPRGKPRWRCCRGSALRPQNEGPVITLAKRERPIEERRHRRIFVDAEREGERAAEQVAARVRPDGAALGAVVPREERMTADGDACACTPGRRESARSRRRPCPTLRRNRGTALRSRNSKRRRSSYQ